MLALWGGWAGISWQGQLGRSSAEAGAVVNLRDLGALRNLFRGGYERRCVRDRESLAALEGGDGEGGRRFPRRMSKFR